MKFRLVKDKIAFFVRDLFERSESLTVAVINTTLIAILFACLSAYLVFVNNTVQQAELIAI